MALVQLTEIIEAFDEPVFFIDSTRRILAQNGAASSIFGDIASGSDLTRAFRNPQALRFIDEILAGETQKEENSSLVFQTTRAITTDFRLTVTKLDNIREMGSKFVVILKDVSHIMEAEQMRSDFVANVSHELRSPLTSIAGFIETLQGAAKEDPVAAQRFLGIMGQEATRMNRIIDDLLSLSKVETTERLRPTTTTDLSAQVERVIDILEPASRQTEKDYRC